MGSLWVFSLICINNLVLLISFCIWEKKKKKQTKPLRFKYSECNTFAAASLMYFLFLSSPAVTPFHSPRGRSHSPRTWGAAADPRRPPREETSGRTTEGDTFKRDEALFRTFPKRDHPHTPARTAHLPLRPPVAQIGVHGAAAPEVPGARSAAARSGRARSRRAGVPLPFPALFPRKAGPHGLFPFQRFSPGKPGPMAFIPLQRLSPGRQSRGSGLRRKLPAMAEGGEGQARWRSGCRSPAGTKRANTRFIGKNSTVAFHKTTKHRDWKDLLVAPGVSAGTAPLQCHLILRRTGALIPIIKLT